MPEPDEPAARTCLITGAGRGIGREVAIRLAAAGHRLAITARGHAQLTETAAACLAAARTGGAGPAGSPEPLVVPLDLTAPGAVDELFARTEAAFGPVQVLVANAGAAASAPLARTSDEEWQRLLDLNLTAPFRCVRRAVPPMVNSGWGRIVAIGSTASRVGGRYIAAYVASKHGLLGLIRSAAVELAGTGVTANVVCPAYVDTPMTDATVARIVELTGRTPEDARHWLERQQPIGRLITVDEVASAVMFCVANGAVTGQAVNVDGGAVQS